ncbi:MAG: hypothetical protein LBR92_02490 [Puniceicoccales bacterium]|jgi:hypothetical protein|nr:hypothetical protein [Puniceicoccales bacterium]
MNIKKIIALGLFCTTGVVGIQNTCMATKWDDQAWVPQKRGGRRAARQTESAESGWWQAAKVVRTMACCAGILYVTYSKKGKDGFLLGAALALAVLGIDYFS